MKEERQIEKQVCSCCKESFDADEMVEFDGRVFCSECLRRETLVCSHCGRRMWSDNNSGDYSIPLCSRCYGDYYTDCGDCGRVIHRNDVVYYNDEPYCQSCYDENYDSRAIKDYSYKPEPIFYGDGNRYFGVELEVDDGGEDDDNAYDVLRVGNSSGDTNIYCKHDGSLGDGFEIVTHPMSLEYHVDKMPWERVLYKLRCLGYLSHGTGSCGLHVHVNRTTFGDTIEEQDSCIGRILYFVEKHWAELLKFSRRTNSQLDRWAARYGYKDHPKEMLDHVKKGSGNGRYSCINLQNYSTIEFRIFRGTLRHNTLIATLQLVNRVCDVAVSLSDEEMKELSWSDFVSACDEPELIQYLKERRLYINEPVVCEEEI